MKFGWLTLSLSPSPEEDAARIDEQLTQACYAEALGFDDIWLTEHYFTGESVYNDPLNLCLSPGDAHDAGSHWLRRASDGPAPPGAVGGAACPAR